MQRVAWIERCGSPAARLVLSDWLGLMVEQSLDGNALNCIAEVIRHSRSMSSQKAATFLRSFAMLLPSVNPAGAAIKRALGSKQRNAMLDRIQLGDFATSPKLA